MNDYKKINMHHISSQPRIPERRGGSYKIYTHIKEVYAGNTAVTLKTDESLGFLAIWEDEAMSYALAGNQLLNEEEILKIIQSAIPPIAAD